MSLDMRVKRANCRSRKRETPGTAVFKQRRSCLGFVVGAVVPLIIGSLINCLSLPTSTSPNIPTQTSPVELT